MMVKIIRLGTERMRMCVCVLDLEHRSFHTYAIELR
jgi:hypothetical protein